MAVDYAKLTTDLLEFYDFAGKSIVYVGFGRRPLLDFSIGAAGMVAVDCDATAVAELERRIAARGLNGCVVPIASRFEEITAHGDVVYLEFCLHEMRDPLAALQHARELAPEVVVFDHSSDSAWMYYAAEEENVRRSAEAISRFPIRRRKRSQTEQRFPDCATLLDKFAGQSEVALKRAEWFHGATDIVIPMDYELDLL